MSESTPPPDSTRTLFELQRLSAEVEELNILLEDSNTIIRSLFQLLRDHNIPVGSTELIKAREKVEAEIQTLRTANVGLVEKVKELEAARTKAAANSLANMLSYEEVEAKMRRLEEENTRLKAGGCARDQKTTQFCAEAVALAQKVNELEAWKADALAVDSKWDPEAIAAMLGATLGESTRAVIQREVPKLVERVKRLEKAGDWMANAAERYGIPYHSHAPEVWREAKGQP